MLDTATKNSQGILILQAQLTIQLAQEQQEIAAHESFNEFEKEYKERINDIGALLFAELNSFRRNMIDYFREHGKVTYRDFKNMEAIDHDLTAYRKIIERG